MSFSVCKVIQLFGVFTKTQNWQYWHQRLYYVKQKNSTHLVRIEPGTYDFKFDTLLSELTWQLLVSLMLVDPDIVMLY